MPLGITPVIAARAQSSAVAKVVLIKNGKAYYKLKNGKSYKQLIINNKLLSGTTVKSEKSTVKLKLLSGALIEIKPGSKMILNRELLNKSSVSLIHGRAAFKIEKLLRSRMSFNVYTPTAVAGVRGTEFELGVAGDASTAVNINEGKVSVNNGKITRELVKDQRAEVSVEGSKMSVSKKQVDMDEWKNEKNTEIKKQPSGKIESINNNLNTTLKEQKEVLSGLSGLKKEDKTEAEKNVDSAFFNQCRTEGLFNAARNIKNNNKEDKNVRDSYKKTCSVYDRLNRLNKRVEEKFDGLEKMFKERSAGMEKKLDEAEKRHEEKFNKLFKDEK